MSGTGPQKTSRVVIVPPWMLQTSPPYHLAEIDEEWGGPRKCGEVLVRGFQAWPGDQRQISDVWLDWSIVLGLSREAVQMAREAVNNGADCDNPIKRLFHPNLSLAYIRFQLKTAVFISTKDSLTRSSEALVARGLQDRLKLSRGYRSARLEAIARLPIGAPGRKGRRINCRSQGLKNAGRKGVN
jgi:hypothetical protein